VFKKIIGWMCAGVLAIGAAISYFFTTRKRNDNNGNIYRIGEQLDGEGERVEREREALGVESGLVSAERKSLERERESLDGERAILDRDKELIAELKKRHGG